MSLAAKQTDMIVGVDIHMVQPPGPVAPVPVPHPFVGMISDASDQPGASVLVNGLPRARAGQVGAGQPPHVPIGGTFVMPVLSEAEVYVGSSTVVAEGEALSLHGAQVITCQDAAGAPAPPRAWKKVPSKSPLMAPMCSLLSIPGGAPVLVGGAPTVAMPGQGQPPPSQLQSVLLKALESQANPHEDGWFDFELKDESGAAIGNAPYEVELPTGEVRRGQLDAYGRGHLHGLSRGRCKVDFPRETALHEVAVRH